MKAMGIGILAKRAGAGIDTVRYYERSGLLKPHGRLASGYREYSELELSRLRFIRRARALGFSLHEVAICLHSRQSGMWGASGVPRKKSLPMSKRGLPLLRRYGMVCPRSSQPVPGMDARKIVRS